MELYSYEKPSTDTQTREYILIPYLSEFSSRDGLEYFLKNHPGSGLTIDDFDFLTKADDSHMREEPIEYPFFKPIDIYKVIEKMEKISSIDPAKFAKLKSFLLDSDSKGYWVQAMVD